VSRQADSSTITALPPRRTFMGTAGVHISLGGPFPPPPPQPQAWSPALPVLTDRPTSFARSSPDRRPRRPRSVRPGWAGADWRTSWVISTTCPGRRSSQPAAFVADGEQQGGAQYVLCEQLETVPGHMGAKCSRRSRVCSFHEGIGSVRSERVPSAARDGGSR